MEIKKVDFPLNHYIQEITKKTQIVVHHTVSGDGIDGDLTWWKKTPDKEGTHFIIDRQGIIYQLFDEKYWAYHLGLKNEHFSKLGLKYQNLNKNSIGIEMDSWGPVLPYGGKYYPIKYNSTLKKYEPNKAAKPLSSYPEEYCGNGFKKHKYFEQYTTKQLESLQWLLKLLCDEHDIPTQYKGDRFWNQNKDALSGEPGIWGHISFRADKSDPHPQQGLVNVLKSIA